MKKIAVLAIVAVCSLTACKKSDNAAAKIKTENVEAAKERDATIKGSPVIKFDKEVHDFGELNEGDVVETSFIVTNKGESDLIISNAKASCGCTVPTWPKEAVKPGESANIDVKFNSKGKPNKLNKTVTLTTNTEKGSETVRITGMVIPKSKK